MPLYPFKCKDCKKEVLKKLPFYEEHHKKVFSCKCGGELKRGWKRIKGK